MMDYLERMGALVNVLDRRISMNLEQGSIYFMDSRTGYHSNTINVSHEAGQQFRDRMERELFKLLRDVEPRLDWGTRLERLLVQFGFWDRPQMQSVKSMSDWYGEEIRHDLKFFEGPMDSRMREKMRITPLELRGNKPKTKAEPIRVTAAEIHAHLYAQAELSLVAPDGFAEVEPQQSERVKTLLAIGFTEQPEVLDYLALKKPYGEAKAKYDLKEEAYQLAMRMTMRYPTYKFISEDALKGVLTKYGLVQKGVDQFTGTIPDKNVAEMARFYEQVRIHDEDQVHKYQNDVYLIAAPADQFKQVRSAPQFLIDPIPSMASMAFLLDDPIVLKPVTDGFLIVTAWGDEASDPDVLNERHN